jgi:hypothetical protein
LSNFFEPVRDTPDREFGRFVMLATREYGRGRVVAFGDSTTWSNFSAFLPGKRELFMGCVDWLSRADSGIPWRAAMLWAALACGGILLWRLRLDWDVVVGARAASAVLCGLVVVSSLGTLWCNSVFPRSTPRDAGRRMVAFVMTPGWWKLPVRSLSVDRSVGIQVFSEWTLRLGLYYGVHDNVLDACSSARTVILTDSEREVTDREKRALADFLREGGTVLALLRGDGGGWREWLADLGFRADDSAVSGARSVRAGSAYWTIGPCRRVGGGHALLLDDSQASVLSKAVIGGGRLYVSTLAGEFTDASMGGDDNVVPDDAMKRRYSLAYGLIECVTTGKDTEALTRYYR